jgi:integrase
VTFEARWYDASGRRHTENYDTAAEADQARQERLRERRRGGSGDPTGGRMSLEAWWGRWMPSRRITDSTKEREEAIWRRHIEPTFGGYRLVDLRRSDIAAWSVSLDRTLAPATVGRCLLLLKKCLSDAVAEGMIAASPAASVAPPERGRVERRFLSLDELQRLEAAVEAWWGLVVPFAATTGLRIGEIAALKVGDLGLAAREVRVSATAVGVSRRVSGDEIRRQVHRPKTTAGERVVPTITDELAERLAVHIDERGLSLDDWLFSGRRGGPMDPAVWRSRVWRPAVERAGLADPKPTPHALRHTAVALWIGAGADRYTVSQWAGHTDASFTERVYGHLWQKDHSETRAAIAELLGGGASVRQLRREA